MTKLVGLNPKTDVNLIDDGSENKKTKRHEKFLQKKKKIKKKKELKFESYNRKRLEGTQLENRINHLEKINLAEIVLKKIIRNL